MSYCVVSENHNTKPRKEVTSSPLNIWDFTNKKKLANKLSPIYHRQCRRYRNHSQSCYKSPWVWYSNLFCHERLSSTKRRVKGSETITIFFWGYTSILSVADGTFPPATAYCFLKVGNAPLSS